MDWPFPAAATLSRYGNEKDSDDDEEGEDDDDAGDNDSDWDDWRGDDACWLVLVTKGPE